MGIHAAVSFGCGLGSCEQLREAMREIGVIRGAVAKAAWTAGAQWSITGSSRRSGSWIRASRPGS